MLDALKEYCDKNKLQVNECKTKIMVFHRGRLPDEPLLFTYGGKTLEIINSFCYLGFWLTVQLSFTRHLEAIITKAKSRVGLLFAKLPLMHIPLHLATEVFQAFIAQIFHYGLALWISNVSTAMLQALDSVWTKFLKRYLGVPVWTNNASILHIVNEQPLSKTLKSRAPHHLGGLIFPEILSGVKLSFLEFTQPVDNNEYDIIPRIPSVFWSTRIIDTIPVNAFYRKRLMREVLDLQHNEICSNINFHVRAEDNCICKICNEHAHPYHIKYCT